VSTAASLLTAASRHRRRRSDNLRAAILGVLGFLIVVWSVAPFLWQVLTAFQEDRSLVQSTPNFWPHPATLEHFWNIFVVKKFHLYLLNSLITAGLSTLIGLLFGSLAAFALARFQGRQRFGILGLILSISMFPQIAILAPLYLLAAQLDLLNTYTVLILVYVAIGLPIIIWVLFGYFSSIPREIDDAATIDGAGPLRTLFSIIIPMALPGVVTTGLISFIAAWNEFMFALAFTSDITRQTVPVGIANFQSLYFIPWGDLAAASVVVTIPLVLMVLLFQRYIIEGLTQGAVKG
jgi:ABC-type glycerol-3-phosphate transport system permease component